MMKLIDTENGFQQVIDYLDGLSEEEQEFFHKKSREMADVLLSASEMAPILLVFFYSQLLLQHYSQDKESTNSENTEKIQEELAP